MAKPGRFTWRSIHYYGECPWVVEARQLGHGITLTTEWEEVDCQDCIARRVEIALMLDYDIRMPPLQDELEKLGRG